MGARDTSTNSNDSVNGNERKTRKENQEVILRKRRANFSEFLIWFIALFIDHIFGRQAKLEYQYLPQTIPNVSETEPKLISNFQSFYEQFDKLIN